MWIPVQIKDGSRRAPISGEKRQEMESNPNFRGAYRFEPAEAEPESPEEETAPPQGVKKSFDVDAAVESLAAMLQEDPEAGMDGLFTDGEAEAIGARLKIGKKQKSKSGLLDAIRAHLLNKRA